MIQSLVISPRLCLWLLLHSSLQSFSFICPPLFSISYLSDILFSKHVKFSKIPVWLNSFQFLFQPKRMTFSRNTLTFEYDFVVFGLWPLGLPHSHGVMWWISLLCFSSLWYHGTFLNVIWDMSVCIPAQTHTLSLGLCLQAFPCQGLVISYS